MQGEVTISMDNSDITMNSHPKKARRAQAFHSTVTEHFHGDFPVFLNRWEEGFELREHDHAYLEIVYVMSGEGYHYVGDHVERTSKGSLYILPIGTSHVIRPSDASGKNSPLVYNICIRPEFLTELGEWLSRYGIGTEILAVLTSDLGTHTTLFDQEMELGYWFEIMYREYTAQKMGYETSILASLMQLTVSIARQLTAEGCSQKEPKSYTELSTILDYIDSHRTESLTVEQLAQKAGMSRRHFIRLFRRDAGMGFSAYLQLRRMEYACRLLLETDYKIAHIAKSAGYQDTAHFRELFRKLMKVSPSTYRTGSNKK